MKRIELFNDHFQNFKVYGIPHAQTLTAGIAGIVAGVWCLYALDIFMSGDDGSSMTLIKDPMISILPTISALVILVIGGLLAGYYPTRRALKVKAIEALREE